MRTLPPVETEKETERHANKEFRDAATEWGAFIFTGLSTVIFFLQLIVFGKQAQRLKETILKMDQVSAAQSTDMSNSIKEAARAADGMEKSAAAMTMVASTLENTAERQLRAYLTVINGGAIFQEKNREKGENLRFEAKPMMVNTGQTPARKVTYQAVAAILPTPLPDDFNFPPGIPTSGRGDLGSQGHFVMNAIVSEFVDDISVEDIKNGNQQSLYVWGTIVYEDIFNKLRQTKFCLRYQWLLDGTVNAFYETKYNEAE